tara:strand:- start:523 stop:852 length:330 start_codon:yes stop_codon:yes gene_type:complete
MSALINFSIDLNKIPKSSINSKDGKAYINLTMSCNDETRYGNNTSVTVRQTKGERDAKAIKQYIGNGQIVWTNGTVVLAEKEEDKEANDEELSMTDPLPMKPSNDFLDF